MAGALRELLAAFSISVDSHELEEANEKVEGFAGKLKLAATTFAEAFAINEVKEFFTESIEQAAHIQDLSERLGVAASSISGFGFAAKSAGLDMDTAAYALGILQKNIGMAVQGGKEQADAFAKLGVHLKDSTGDIKPLNETLLDVADGMSKLPSQAERSAYAMRLLGRSGQQLLPILSKGREGVEEFLGEASELGVVLGDDFYANAKKAREEGEHFGYAIQALKDRALIAVLPIIMKLLTTLVDWTKKVVELTTKTNALQTIMASLAVVAGFKLIGTLKTLAQTFGLLQPTIAGTVTNLLRLAKPVLLVAALYLVFDELYTLMTGGKTIIGDTLDELFGLGTAAGVALELNAIFKDTVNVLKDVGIVLGDTLLGTLDTVLASIGAVGAALLDIMKLKFSDIGKDMKEQFTTGPFAPGKRGQGIIDAGTRLVNGTDTKHLEDLNVLMKAGIDPRMLQAGQLGRATVGAANATREGIVAQNAENPLAHGWYAAPMHGGQHHSATKIDVKVTNHIKSAHDNPKAIGDAAGMGTATAVEKANNAALASAVRS